MLLFDVKVKSYMIFFQFFYNLYEFFEIIYKWCSEHIYFITLLAGIIGYWIKKIRARNKAGIGFFTVFTQFTTIIKTLELLRVTVEENFVKEREYTSKEFEKLNCEHKYIKAQINLLEQSSVIAIWKANKNGQCIFVNDAYCELFGKDYDELQGDGWLNVIADIELDRTLKLWRNAIEARTSSYLEFLANTIYGERRVKAYFNAVIDVKGEIEFHGTVQLINKEI